VTRRIRVLIWAILFAISVGPVIAEDGGTISIGTFNLQRFGENGETERIRNISRICRGIDLLAIQEVHPDGGAAVAALAKALGSEYQWAVSEETTWERFAFIWRDPVIAMRPPALNRELKLGRRPFVGHFKAGNFDFVVVNVHLFWDGSKKTYPHTRSVEFKLLDDWLCYREDAELDVLLVGDFNAPNMYYGYRFPPPLTSHYHFYEMLQRHNMISVSIDRGIPTSIANENLYDHIIFNPAHNFVEEFAGMESVEVIQWDKEWDRNGDGRLDWEEHTRARRAVTDHRPVKAIFRIDLPDDDEEDAEAATKKADTE